MEYWPSLNHPPKRNITEYYFFLFNNVALGCVTLSNIKYKYTFQKHHKMKPALQLVSEVHNFPSPREKNC